MKAAYISEHGGVDTLLYSDLPDPIPRRNEVLVRVKACGVNHLDVWVRKGLPHFGPRRFPHIPGSDIAGEVAAAGPYAPPAMLESQVVLYPGVSCGYCARCLAGRDDLCSRYQIMGVDLPGGYAELVKIPADSLIPLPAGMPWERAACIPGVFATAWSMLLEKGKLQPGEWVLIHAAGSGVGSAAIQLARLIGANIIATASSDDKLEKARALGVQYLVNYKIQDFLREVRRITQRRGVDVVIEHIGQDVWERNLLCLAAGGRLVTCGVTSGYEAKTDLRHVFYRQLQIFGNKGSSKATLKKVVRLLAEEKIEPVLDRVLPLKEARRAHHLLEGREVFGKIVLIPG
jgi:NADPH:quinone reductase-like Zn-dependent oxidoreductase